MPFKVQVIEGIEDETEAMLRIIERQFARRNLTNFQKAELALSYEKYESERAKERVKLTQFKKNDNSTAPQNFGESSEEAKEIKGEALELAAKRFGIGTETARRVKKVFESDDEELKKKARENKVSPGAAYKILTKKERRENYKKMKWLLN